MKNIFESHHMCCSLQLKRNKSFAGFIFAAVLDKYHLNNK